MFVSSSLLVCKAPVLYTGNQTVEVSNDGITFYGSVGVYVQESDLIQTPVQSFEGQGMTEITDIWPLIGSVQGGTLLEDRGRDLPATGDVTCRLGGVVSDAEAVSSTLVRCVTPAVEVTGSVAVGVSGNGVEYAEGAVEFE